MKHDSHPDNLKTPSPRNTGNNSADANPGKELDTRGESGNLPDPDTFSPGPGEATSGRNKTMEGARQGGSEA